MKLIRLKIKEQFRSLQADFEINFRESEAYAGLEEFHPFCLAGLNGSGKSNILEALANIFYHLECCANKFKPTFFEDNLKVEISNPDAYELVYLIHKSTELFRVTITKEKAKAPQMQVELADAGIDNSTKETPNLIADVRKEAAYGKTFLPDLVVGYSSGENEILSLPFIKMRLFQHDEYIQAIDDKIQYTEPESSLIYIDYEMSQAVLASILLFENEKTIEPLKKELGVDGIKRFRINLNKHVRPDKKDKERNIQVLAQLTEFVDKLKWCATCFFENENVIHLDYWVTDETKKAFKFHFKSAFGLFRFFQIAQVLNYRILSDEIKKDVYSSQGYYTDWKLPSPMSNDEVFNFSHYFISKTNKGESIERELLLKNLSDGEQQFLHTLGICLMLQNKRTLLLLDEPETHFNPDWRSKFIKILRDTLRAGGDNFLLKDIVLTSHSPFIISDCLPDKVIVFERNSETKGGGVECKNARELDFNTYGTSIDIITEIIFKNSNTIGDLSREQLQKIDFNKIKSKIDVENAKQKIANMGDSIEKDLTLLRLNKLQFD